MTPSERQDTRMTTGERRCVEDEARRRAAAAAAVARDADRIMVEEIFPEELLLRSN